MQVLISYIPAQILILFHQFKDKFQLPSKEFVTQSYWFDSLLCYFGNFAELNSLMPWRLRALNNRVCNCPL